MRDIEGDQKISTSAHLKSLLYPGVNKASNLERGLGLLSRWLLKHHCIPWGVHLQDSLPASLLCDAGTPSSISAAVTIHCASVIFNSTEGRQCFTYIIDILFFPNDPLEGILTDMAHSIISQVCSEHLPHSRHWARVSSSGSDQSRP